MTRISYRRTKRLIVDPRIDRSVNFTYIDIRQKFSHKLLLDISIAKYFEIVNVSIVIVNYQFSRNNIQQNIGDLCEILLERVFLRCYKLFVMQIEKCGKINYILGGVCTLFLQFRYNIYMLARYALIFNRQYFMNSATCFEIELNIVISNHSKITDFPSFLLSFFFFSKRFFN